MTMYGIVRMLHIFGAMGMFVALGVELASLRGLSSARTAGEARGAMGVQRVNAVVGPVALLLVVLTGGYMAHAGWGLPPWLLLALVALVALFVIGGWTRRKAAATLGRAAEESTSPDATTLPDRAFVHTMRASLVARTLLLVAIVVLMSVKPGVDGGLLVVGVAGALAVIGVLPFRRSARAARPGWNAGAGAPMDHGERA
jgi:hypothetical protein